jgi:hypothetical protein
MIMGIGPMRITPPALELDKFVIDPKATRSIPMKMAAKARRNNRLARPNWRGWPVTISGDAWTVLCALHAWHVQVEVSKQFLQVGLPQLPHT